MPDPGSHRGSILVEQARLLRRREWPAGQYEFRLHSPGIAARALAGSFVHLQCDPLLPMRRPMSLMAADRQAGWVDILFKVHGHGTALLARREVGEELSLIGPIGVPFRQSGYRPRPLLIGGGVGIPPMVFLARHLRDTAPQARPFAIMGSEVPFPFTPRPSSFLVEGLPAGVIAGMPLLEAWGVPTRLASAAGQPGCHPGFVTELARDWLETLERVEEVEIFACGPTPMLRAVQALAAEYGLPCQLSLEEYMACAVGGCAGCAVPIRQGEEVAMKRVCVDGPVFEAEGVAFS